MGHYAEQTTVNIQKTKLDVRDILVKHGATNVKVSNTESICGIIFTMAGRNFKVVSAIPSLDQFSTTPTGQRRSMVETEQAWEQGKRQKWRALYLSIKGKLVSVEEKIETLERAFMAHIVLSDGKLLGDNIKRLTEGGSSVERRNGNVIEVSAAAY